MVRYAGGSTGSGSASGPRSAYKPSVNPGLSGGTRRSERRVDEGLDPGKGTIDLYDVPGSVGDTLGSAGEFVGAVGGGLLGAIGSIGPSQDVNIGKIPEAIGAGLGAVGGIELPRVRVDGIGDPNAPAATVGDIPGAMLDVVTAPGRALERTVAGQRVEGNIGAFDFGSFITGNAALAGMKLGAGLDGDLPADLQARLDAGESVDVIADELVARGAGFNNDPLQNLGAQIVFDPLNVIAPGAARVGGAIRDAGAAVRAANDLSQLGIGTRAAGVAYNTAARNLSRGGQAFVDRAIGPVTSGALHALGTKPYRSIVGGAAKLDRAYGQAAEDAAAVANADLMNAVIADDIATDLAAGLAKADSFEADLGSRLSARRTYAPDELERRAQEMLERTAPTFLKETPEELAEISARQLATATGMSVEDARRVIGPRADVATARTTHWMRYGRAIDDFGEAREAARGGATNIDLDRLTLIADDTLTMERAEEILLGAIDVRTAESRFSILANHFLGKNPSDDQVRDFIEKLVQEKALPAAVKMPKSGKNKLPGPLSEWRVKYRDNGYDLGFAPEGGLKTITDPDGTVVWSKPWVGVSTRRDPVTVRNGLGRAMDSMFRGVTQTTIVQQSRERLVRAIAKADLPISPNQARSIHKAIIDEAADRSLTPRALVGEKRGGEPLYNAIFRDFLSPEEYDAVVAQYDPTYLVMQAFEGNLATVGLTQKVTGRAKATLPIIAKITESLYPKARFTYRPNFQAQEMIESPVFNALRGIEPRDIDPDIAKAYRALAEQPEFRHLTEASYLNIAGDRLVTRFMGKNTPVGRAMGRFANIQARKEHARVTQVLAEHGEEFKTAVNEINPKAWKAMEEAYGTTDPRLIADRFLAERLRLTSGDIDEAMTLLDEMEDDVIGHLQQTLDGDVVRMGAEAASQRANIAVAAQRGGTMASGGATRASGAIPNDRVAEMVWQAFKDSFRERSIRAFQTHFFNPQRGWLERTLNHPYLGLYPLSYMWGKVLPEFARFLVARPFGKKAPLVGYNALDRVRQAYVGALADDEEFRAHIENNAEAIYFANLLFPGNPSNLAVNAPAWARHLAEDQMAGRTPGPSDVSREIVRSTSYALNPLNEFTQLTGINDQVFEQLDKAAREFDGMAGLTP